MRRHLSRLALCCQYSRHLLPFLCVVSGAIAARPALAATDGLPADPNFRYFGRWDRADVSEYVAQWAGAYLRVGFTGARVAIRLGEGEPSSFFAAIDGGPPVEYRDRAGLVDLTPAEGMKPTSPGGGPHQLFLIARVGKPLRFRGLAPGGDRTARTAPPKVGARSVLFVGDSITFGASAANPTLDAWAPRAAAAAGCEYARIAQGGIGLVDGYDAPIGRRGMEKQFGMLGAFGSARGDAPFAGWADERPDIVVVNLGTNDADSNEKNPAPLDVFRDRYVGFLTTLRARYPAATILVLEPFNRNGGKCKAVREAVERHTTVTGDRRAFCISTEGWVNPAGGDIAPDWSHPTDQGHGKLARRMTEALRELLR